MMVNMVVELLLTFETVNHNTLLTKLEHAGIRGNILKWFESYLSGREQFVFHKGVSSDTASITCIVSSEKMG